MRCDVTDTESVNAAFDEAEQKLGGPVEVLVANAGITRTRLLMRMSDEELDAVIDTNLAGAFRVRPAREQGHDPAAPRPDHLHLQRRRPLRAPGQANYAASKSGLVGLARSITRELGGRGITANVVAPGFIETDMTAALPEDARSPTMPPSRPAGSREPDGGRAASCASSRAPTPHTSPAP